MCIDVRPPGLLQKEKTALALPHAAAALSSQNELRRKRHVGWGGTSLAHWGVIIAIPLLVNVCLLDNHNDKTTMAEALQCSGLPAAVWVGCTAYSA